MAHSVTIYTLYMTPNDKERFTLKKEKTVKSVLEH